MIAMAGHFLYSTNCWLKYVIQKEFQGDQHYVWCSDVFRASSTSRYSLQSQIPESSSPADVYESLRRDVKSLDRHSTKIESTKASLKRLAVQWHEAGTVEDDQRDEIVALVDGAEFAQWRPLIYVIPRSVIGGRAKPVPPCMIV